MRVTISESLPLEDVLKSSVSHTCSIKLDCLLSHTTQGDLLPIVLISDRNAAGVSSLHWRMSSNTHSKITAKRKSKHINKIKWLMVSTRSHSWPSAIWQCVCVCVCSFCVPLNVFVLWTDAGGRYAPELADVLQRPFTFSSLATLSF